MPISDFTGDQLRSYDPNLAAPSDLGSFWASTLAESRGLTKPIQLERVDCGFTLVDTNDVTFSGFGGQPVQGWLHAPANAINPLPTVVRYIGYGGGRGLAVDVSPWPLAGYACFTMDTRGQGSQWSPGDTPDPVGAGPAAPGFLTRGIEDPAGHYYRRLYTDAVLAIDAIRQLAFVDEKRVAVTGHSQGGGLAIAVSALQPDIAAVLPDVPFLCDFPRAIQITDTDPYAEIVRYLKVHRDRVQESMKTLAYFDCAVLARKSVAPALFSVGLMDQICPPSTVYAAYNAYGGSKEIVDYPFNDHEGGEGFHRAIQLGWLANLMS